MYINTYVLVVVIEKGHARVLVAIFLDSEVNVRN